MRTLDRPDILLRENPNAKTQGLPEEDSSDLFRVVIIDNDYNTYQEVIDITMLALGVDFDHAFKIALAVDHNGEADVLHAPKAEAERIAGIIRTIGIEVRVLSVNDTG